MAARIAGFHTRADLRLRAPRSISRNIQPHRGGVAVHYGGNAVGANREHAHHINVWRNWQAFHMDTRGWADIAYTGGFCNCGWAFAGRGAGLRTGANGTNDGNLRFYAATWIGGLGEQPTQAALDAADWWVNELRTAGGAGAQVLPHRAFKATGCPGDPMAAYAASRHNRAITVPQAGWGPYQDKDDMWYGEIIASYAEAGYTLDSTTDKGRSHWRDIRVWAHHVYNRPIQDRDAVVRDIRSLLGI